MYLMQFTTTVNSTNCEHIHDRQEKTHNNAADTRFGRVNTASPTKANNHYHSASECGILLPLLPSAADNKQDRNRAYVGHRDAFEITGVAAAS